MVATKRQDAESLLYAYDQYKKYLHGRTSTVKSLVIYSVRSDNGGNYISEQFKGVLSKDKTRHELSPAYEHEGNGTAEAGIQTLKDMATVALCRFPKTPQAFWDEFTNAACVVSNMVPMAPSLHHHMSVMSMSVHSLCCPMMAMMHRCLRMLPAVAQLLASTVNSYHISTCRYMLRSYI